MHGRHVAALEQHDQFEQYTGGDRTESPDEHQQRRDDQPAEKQVRVEPEPFHHGRERGGCRIQQRAGRLAVDQLPPGRAEQAGMTRSFEQLAFGHSVDEVARHEQDAQPAGHHKDMRAGAAVGVLDHRPHECGRQQQRCLFGQRRHAEGQTRADDSHHGASPGDGQREGQQNPRRHQIVEEGPPRVGQGDRAQREQQTSDGRQWTDEAQSPTQPVEEDDRRELGQQHALAAEGDRRVVAVESAGEHRPQGDLDPAARRVVVEVGVGRQRLLVLHRPRLAQVGAGVVDVARVVVHPQAVHPAGDHQGGQQPQHSSPPEPQGATHGLTDAGAQRREVGRGEPRKRPRPVESGGHRRVCRTRGSSTARWAPTWVVFTQSVTPRRCRTMAMTAARASAIWNRGAPMTRPA